MTALRAKWTIRIERLETRLAAGTGPDELKPQRVLVSLVISGLARATPIEASDCIDPQVVCEWITREWPRSAHTPLLQTRVNELLAYVLGGDKRVQDAWVGIYRPQAAGPAAACVGVERQMSRAQFEAQKRMARTRVRAAASG